MDGRCGVKKISDKERLDWLTTQPINCWMRIYDNATISQAENWTSYEEATRAVIDAAMRQIEKERK